MNDHERTLEDGFARLAATLPRTLLEGLAEAVGPCDPSDWPSIRNRAVM
jgi:hypothetical protein